jgi:hypothetical protein
MSTFTIDWLPGERIILGKIFRDYNAVRDTKAASVRLLTLLQSSDSPVPYLLDLTEIQMTFGEMVQAMGLLTRGDLAAFVHPKLKQIVIVSNEALIKLGATALGQAQYGGRKAQVVGSVAEGLNYLRAQERLIAELERG